MDVGPLRDVLTVLLGTGTGLLSGLFGVGGGVVSQPGMRLMGIEPLMVIGTALPVIIPGAASGARRYVRERLVHWPAVVATVPAGLIAAVAGGLVAEHVPGNGHALQLMTATLLGLSAYRMARTPGPRADPLAETDAPEAPTRRDATIAPEPATARLRIRGWSVASARGVEDVADLWAVGRYVAIGAIAGGLSGLLGIGGGVVMVPAFVALARLDVKPAIATSLVCVGAFAVPGTITHVALGHVDWRVVAALVVGVIPGARLGAALTIRATDRRLRLTVASFLGLIAVVYFSGELIALL